MFLKILFFKLVVLGSALSSLLTAEPLTTFLFPISTHAFYIPTGKFYIGAGKELLANSFAVAEAQRTTSDFVGLTPPQVTLNNQPKVTNPLNGAAILHMTLIGLHPIVTKKGLATSIFYIDEFSKGAFVFEASDIKNALQESPGSQLALTSTAAQVTAALENNASVAALIAVGNKNGGFDGNGSGIAVAYFKQFTPKDPTKKFFAWDIIDALTGASQYTTDGTFQPTAGNKAKAVGKNTPELFIGVPLSSIDTLVDMHYDRELGRLYVALDVTAGQSPQAGARAVLVGTLSNGRLLFQPIAPDSAFDSTDLIVGQRKPLSRTTIYKVRTLQTRTHVRYLVVVGGNGSDPLLKRSVHALPLVDNIDSAAHGTLASVNQRPSELFTDTRPFRFVSRIFVSPARTPQDLFTMNESHALVGGGALLPGDITDIWVSGESVFVSCGTADASSTIASGIFISQPLFDQFGAIRSWTRWQRVAGASQAVSGFAYDPLVGVFWYIPVKGPHIFENTTVIRNSWKTDTDEFTDFIAQEFPKVTGGVQGLFDIPFTHAALNESEMPSLQVFTGFKKVLFLQTGRNMNGVFTPRIDVSFPFVAKNGTLEGFFESGARISSGGVLDELGALSSAAIITDGNFGWFVVGGAHGVAVLADSEGRGWSVPPGLGINFKGLTAQMAWKKITTTEQVRKLIAHNGMLFVLSEKKLERLAFSSENIVRGITSISVAELTPEQVCEEHSYSDVLISGPLALLATSFGLFRSGDAVDIQTVGAVALTRWQPLALFESVGSSEGPGPVTRLYAISTTGDETDVAFGGNVYVLNAAVSTSQALIYRLTVQLEDGSVGPRTVQPFPDVFIQGPPTFFANLGDYRNYVVTDGALIAVSRSAFGAAGPILELLPPGFKSGELLGTRSRVPFVLIPPHFCTIGKLLRSSASGSWIVPGDFGIRIQE